MPTDLIKTLMAMGPNGEAPWRKDVFNEVVEGYTVDTCNTVDTGWETGIKAPKGAKSLGYGGWIIVESYPSRDDAEKGHDKWVAYIKSGGRDFPDNQP